MPPAPDGTLGAEVSALTPLSLRRQILTISTKSEHARADRIASQMNSIQMDSQTDPLVTAKLLRRQQKRNSVMVHYTYERPFAYYKSKIHQIWNASFPPNTGIDTNLIVLTRINPNSTQELLSEVYLSQQAKSINNTSFNNK